MPNVVSSIVPATVPCITIEQVLACPNLPSLPTVAVEVLNLAGKRDVQLEDIARVIQNDAALCARILRTVNSSFYGLSKPCPTMSRALAYLGVNTVKSLVLGFSLVDCVGGKDDEHDIREYWGRSVLSAAASRRLALLTGMCDAEEAFLAALVQDIGVLALRRAIGAAYGDVVSQSKGNHHRLCALCREAFNLDHAQAGAALAQRWRFPSEIVQAIACHHDEPAGLANAPVLVRLVATCNQLVSAILENSSSDRILNSRASISALFDLTFSQIDEFISAAIEDAQSLSALLKVNVGSYPDIATLLAQAEEARLEQQIEIHRETQRLQQTNSDLVRLVLTDALTGAGSRKRFDTELAAIFSIGRSPINTVGLIMIDVDKFKSFNDAHGHQAGDYVLTEMARRMMNTVGHAGVVCRYGGEEFAVVLASATRKETAQVAEAIRRIISDTAFDLQSCGTHQSVQVTVSLGVAVYEPTLSSSLGTPQLLVQGADRALYAAKHANRNCVRMFSPKVSTSVNAA